LSDHSLSDHSLSDKARASRLAEQSDPPLDVRSERIAAIQAAIADGTYQVSPEETAEAILAEQQVRDGTAA
jgi:flagellar biosynthesis anti-sigma factor FlgM